MECHDILMRQLIERRMHLFFERFKLRAILKRILAIRVLMGRVRLAELGRDGFDLRNRVGHRRPYMRIFFLTSLQKMDILIIRCLDDLELLILLHSFIEEAFHPRTIDHEHIRLLQRLHILSRQLIVMQAARLRFRHVDDFDPIDPLGDIDDIDIHRIERSHNRKILLIATLL